MYHSWNHIAFRFQLIFAASVVRITFGFKLKKLVFFFILVKLRLDWHAILTTDEFIETLVFKSGSLLYKIELLMVIFNGLSFNRIRGGFRGLSHNFSIRRKLSCDATKWLSLLKPNRLSFGNWNDQWHWNWMHSN